VGQVSLHQVALEDQVGAEKTSSQKAKGQQPHT